MNVFRYFVGRKRVSDVLRYFILGQRTTLLKLYNRCDSFPPGFVGVPRQRQFRDIHVVTQHMMVNESTLELVGRLMLGQDTNTAKL